MLPADSGGEDAHLRSGGVGGVGGVGGAYSGWFAAHLLNFYSPEQYVRWMTMLHDGDSYELIAEAFEVVYGISLEKVWYFAPETIPCPFNYQ